MGKPNPPKATDPCEIVRQAHGAAVRFRKLLSSFGQRPAPQFRSRAFGAPGLIGFELPPTRNRLSGFGQSQDSWAAHLFVIYPERTRNCGSQYHFRSSAAGLCAWDVRRLVELSSGFARERIPLTEIKELDEPYWCGEPSQKMTCREVVEHSRLILDCNLDFPVILSSDGRVMDGMHRICKALFEGRSEIESVRFVQDPEPDYVGIEPHDLPSCDRVDVPTRER